jgi:hypothetical protein
MNLQDFICLCCSNSGLLNASLKNQTKLINHRKGNKAKPPGKNKTNYDIFVLYVKYGIKLWLQSQLSDNDARQVPEPVRNVTRIEIRNNLQKSHLLKYFCEINGKMSIRWTLSDHLCLRHRRPESPAQMHHLGGKVKIARSRHCESGKRFALFGAPLAPWPNYCKVEDFVIIFGYAILPFYPAGTFKSFRRGVDSVLVPLTKVIFPTQIQFVFIFHLAEIHFLREKKIKFEILKSQLD